MAYTMLALRDSRSWTGRGWSQRAQQGTAHPAPLPISFLGPALLRPHPSYEAARRSLGRWSTSLWSLHILQELLSGPLAFASIGFLSEEEATLLSSAKDPLH